MGVVGRHWRGLLTPRLRPVYSGTWLESLAKEGDSPVREMDKARLDVVPEYGGTRETLSESGRTIFQG